MAVRILCEVAEQYGIAPLVLWTQCTRSQLVLMYKDSAARYKERLANEALMTRAAVATAILNTIAGKDVPEFDDTLDDMTGRTRYTRALPEEAMPQLGIQRQPATDGGEWEAMSDGQDD